MSKEQNKKLDRLLTSLEKNYNVQKASEIKREEPIRTGVFPLDYVLSGGIYQGEGGHRIEFFGAESSGKTTFALHIIKKYQELGKTCVFLDAENSYDTTWAEIIGVDNDNLIVIHPTSLEEAGDIFTKLTPEVDLIVIDSIVSLIPEEEIDRDTNQPTMALGARINALITRKLYKALVGKKTTLIFINQLREKVGQLYGNPHTTGGGRALKHFYHTRVEFRAGKPIDIGSGDKKERIGVEINLHTVKNKKGKPHNRAIIDFFFDGKLDNKKSVFFSGLKYGVIELSGKTYTYKDKKAIGKEKAMEMLTNKDLEKIQEEIWKRIK